VALNTNQLHRLELRFHGTRVEASLDEKPLASIVSTAHSRGMFGLGSEWDHVQFDNLDVRQ
jgi:hypothetical protein